MRIKILIFLLTILFAGCAHNPPSAILADVSPARIPHEDMMSPIVLNNALTAIDSFEKSLDWKPFRPGVEIARVYSTPEGGCSAAFLKYQPGAAVPLHMHGGWEHIFILKGSQIDRSGEHFAGSVVINPPGSSHSVDSPSGCIVLIIWEKPVIFAPAPTAGR